MPRKRKKVQARLSRAKQGNTEMLRQFIEANSSESIQCAAGESPEIDLEQEVPRFKGVAYSGGPLYWQGAPGPVILDLAGLSIPSQIVASGREHDRDAIVGNTTSVTNTGTQLRCEGVLSGDDQTVIETSRRAKAAGSQFPWQLTIDADYSKRQDIEVLMPRTTARINGRQVTGPALIVRRSTLRMIDFTVKGADQHAKAVVQASAASEGFEMSFEDWVTSLGFVPADLTDVQRAGLQKQYDALMADESAEGDDSGDAASVTASSRTPMDFSKFVNDAKKAARDAAADELKRHADIRAAIKAHAPNGLTFKQNNQEYDLEQFAIENDWSAKDAELQALRESRPKAPAGRSDTLLASSDAITLALAVKGGMDIDRVFDRRLAIEASKPMPGWIFLDSNNDQRAKLMEAAHKLRGRNSIDLAIASLQASGQGGFGMDVTEAIQASFSSNSFGNILNSSAQITVLAKFDETADTTEWVDDKTPAKNFLASTDVRLKTASGSLSKLAPGGTAKPGKLDDTGEVYKADRYAESFVIDEQELINDRLGLIMMGLGEYGEKAKRLKPDLVYALLMSNPTLSSDSIALFHASHLNIQGGAMSEATLAAAIALLAKAKENGRGIDAKATDILVPPSLSFTVEGYLTSTGRIPIDTVGGPTENMLKKRNIKVIEEQRLENGVVDPDSGSTVNGSALLSYLIDRNRCPIKAYYVEATGRSPIVRREALGVGQFGLAITTALDIGVAAVRYQTAVRLTGA